MKKLQLIPIQEEVYSIEFDAHLLLRPWHCDIIYTLFNAYSIEQSAEDTISLYDIPREKMHLALLCMKDMFDNILCRVYKEKDLICAIQL